MELAKVTTKGQVTIPKAIRESLNLKEGSKILFIQKGNDIVIKNSVMIALEKIERISNASNVRYKYYYFCSCI